MGYEGVLWDRRVYCGIGGECTVREDEGVLLDGRVYWGLIGILRDMRVTVG